MGTSLKAFVTVCSVMMALTDVWVPILFGVVYWLNEENNGRLLILMRQVSPIRNACCVPICFQFHMQNSSDFNNDGSDDR